ncbi:hypothetical protein AAZX31_10G063400 [Glycine max]|nr:hypothetical protein JHK85_027757 [Glycine max]KAH1227863.1 hypothetical protein GmHk_10G027989 [Glycine max]
MAEKLHLREFLQEDQEPFLLKHYISERRSQLKRVTPSPNSTLPQQLKKNPQNSNFPLNKCFLTSLQNATKSPLLLSPKKSTPLTLRPSNAKTASLLLEAALRIHTNKNAKPKPKPNRALGIFGSLFKKLTNRKRETIEGGAVAKVNKDSDDDDVVVVGSCEVGFTCSCNGRPSSAVWSESNEDKSLDLESSSSGNSFDDSVVEEIEFLNKGKLINADDHGFFCQSPFRFSLQRSPDYSGRRTPVFSSPAAAPCRRKTEDKEINGADGVNKFHSGEEEEDKEQCSPVSVLDPPFDDDNDDGHDHDNGDDVFDLDCSYANVQRTKQHLLDRLCRFEKLAELDPVELEKRMLDHEDREYETFTEEDDDHEDVDSETACEENILRGEMFEILCCRSSVQQDTQQAQAEDLKRLVYDLIKEEETTQVNNNCSDMVIRRVLRKLELWKEVESNTIDMMIEEDFSREQCRWKKNDEHTKELAVEVELAIFCFLVEELSEELLIC